MATDTDYNYISNASYQCLQCNKVHVKKYEPPVLWSIFNHERERKMFVCPDCNITCEAVGHYLETEKPVVIEPGLIGTIPKVLQKDIDFVLQIIKEEAKHDEPSIKQLFYGMSTAFTRLGMGHKINSRDSGAGKSYLTNKVAGYFPTKHVLILGGASNKAFQHKQGELVIKDEDGNYLPLFIELDKLEMKLENLDPDGDEAKKIQREIKLVKSQAHKLIDLDNTIIVIQDTPQEGLLANIMSLVSQDSERDQEYLFVDDKLQGTSNIIHGMPVIFYTRVLDDTRNARAEEVFRRFVNVTPSATREKVQEANRITFKRYGLMPEEYGDQVVSGTDKLRAKEIVANMVEHLKAHSEYLGPKESGVRILFEETLSHAMPCDDVFQMTVSDRLARYLSIITKVNMCSRPRFVHKATGAFYPVSTFEDLKEAFSLMEMGGSNIRPYLVVMYNEVIYPLYSEMDEPKKDKDSSGNVLDAEKIKALRAQEIIDGAKERLGLTISSKAIHYKYLIPMAELGLINWAKSELKGNEKIYYPSDPDSPKVHSLFPEDDLRLTVNDEAFYPNSKNLEQSYGFRSKLSYKEGGKNISDIYRLEDPEGTEITLAELIDKYLSNPELCFKTKFGRSNNQNYAVQIVLNHLRNI